MTTRSPNRPRRKPQTTQPIKPDETTAIVKADDRQQPNTIRVEVDLERLIVATVKAIFQTFSGR